MSSIATQDRAQEATPAEAAGCAEGTEAGGAVAARAAAGQERAAGETGPRGADEGPAAGARAAGAGATADTDAAADTGTQAVSASTETAGEGARTSAASTKAAPPGAAAMGLQPAGAPSDAADHTPTGDDAPAPVPLFQIRDAEVVRAGRTILSVGHFDLAEGEHVALLGPNGAGKSTFIQLLTREVFPLHRGEPPVRFRGQARPLLTDIKRALGIVSATMHDQVRVHLPVDEIVMGGLTGSLGLPKHARIPADARTRVLEALDRLGIASLADRDVMTLSTGQVRRVLVARELMSDPKILIFDEPCTGLDPEGMYHVRETMSLLAAEGRSVVLVTHYPEDIIPAIERVLLIKDARVFADGPKEELLRDETLSELFGVPLEVEERNGWYALRGRY